MKDDAGSADIGLDKMEIRHMLRIAGGEKLRAAVALTREGKAIILLDRHKQPRALEREIKDQVPDSRLHRFGTFTADPDDKKLARFTLNRASPGMARKLMLALKGSGLRRVEIALEGEEVSEAAEDVDGDRDIATYDPGSRRQQADDRARHTELTHRLAELVHQIAGVAGPDHARRSELVTLAEAAQDKLKHDKLAEAEAGIAALRRAMG
ncbi:MAG TPA: hypothetical protein VE650_12545 [Acetobacteraceae bacterium]|nr:hypothetical protein [Acetobacteraceae bacterium]